MYKMKSGSIEAQGVPYIQLFDALNTYLSHWQSAPSSLSLSKLPQEAGKEAARTEQSSALLRFPSCISKDHLMSLFFLQQPMHLTQTYSHKKWNIQ